MRALHRILNVRDLWSITRKAAAAWVSDNASSMGAALAFYSLFSFAPILIVALTIVGYVFGPEIAQQQVLSQLPDLLGADGAKVAQRMAFSAHESSQTGFAALIGVIILIVGATSVFQELQQSLEKIWKTPELTRKFPWWRLIRDRILSLGFVLSTGFLLLVSLLASTALNAVGHWLGGILPPLLYVLFWFNFVVSFAVTALLFAMIFKYTPRERIAWEDVWVGAVVTTVLFTAGKALIGIIIGKSTFNSVYGAAGSLIVLLLWIYYSTQIFLFGAEFTCAFAYARGSRRAAETAIAPPT
jgi:membrane protein